jgi:hypothetical protein
LDVEGRLISHVDRHWPVPETLTTCGLLFPAALCDTVTTPCISPVTVGVNVTANVQDPGVWPVADETVDPQGEAPPEITE